MKALIARYVARLDAASLRERILVFVMLAALAYLIFHVALLGPLQERQRRAQAEIDAQQKQLAALSAALAGLARDATSDPDAGQRARQNDLRADLEALDARIAEEQRRFTPPERMRAVLQDILEGNKQLTLVDLKTLPPVSLTASDPAHDGGRALYRHGIELSVRGGYLDLHAYLKTLEALPSQLYWGRAELAVDGYPAATLKLVLYTVSFERTWLTV